MRLGQTSVVYFLSKLVSSASGFLATIYIARTLGSGPLGEYHLVIGLVSWLAIVGEVGLSRAISKRVSEGRDQSEYALAGLSIIVGLAAFTTCGLLLVQDQIVDYVGYPATEYIIAILVVVLVNGFVNALLVGLHQVHVSGFLSPIRTGSRTLFQIALVAAGASTAGLFVGHIVGYVVVIVIGGYFIVQNLSGVARPERRHFERLVDFAKFSWLGSLQSQMFSYTDVIVLGFFVPSGLIGVYAAAWNIAEFLILFSGALSSTLFPEVSSLSTNEESQAVSRIVEQSLSYGGLFLVPGLFGGALLGERILRMYGPAFPKGTTILTILIAANLCMGYQNQLVNTLDAIDRPELAFRINVVFVGANLVLNVVLIHRHGWIGAAVATAASVVISLVLAYYHVDAIVDFQIPTREIGKQWIAALLMSGVVYAGLWVENTYRPLGHNVATVIVLVALGAGVYFAVLLTISAEFRLTVDRNVPFDVPFVHSQ